MRIILYLTAILSTQLWAMPDTIEITAPTSVSLQPFFERDQYKRGELNVGTKAEIVSLNTNHKDGVSLQVRVSAGPERGKIVWVHLPEDPTKRSFSVVDKKGDTLKIAGDNKTLQNTFASFKKSTTKIGALEVYSKIPELVDIKSDKEIWDGFIEGKLKLDAESSDNKMFSFVERKKNEGMETVRKYTAPISPKHVGAIPESIEKISQTEIDCEETPATLSATGTKKYTWLPGCEVLSSGVSDSSRNKLEKCYNSIRMTLSEGKKLRAKDRARVFPEFYKKLNPVEQEFMASIVTSVGEAGNLVPPAEEMVAIMMVLNNRKRYAQDKGFQTANMLDAALQGYQFSMYNKGAHHWADALNNGESDIRVDNAITAFIKFRNLKVDPKYKNIYHYHTNYVKPDWRSNSKIVPVTLNGIQLRQASAKSVRHIFYRDIGWSFRHNPWGKK